MARIGDILEGKKTSFFSHNSLWLLKWEEKAIYEAAQKKGIEIKNIDCKDIVLDLNTFSPEYTNQTIIQRCVSYFKNLDSTAALEGLGANVINPLNTNVTCGKQIIYPYVTT